ncbi:MAG: DUF2461 domain-containing protein [Chitinophagales bacterium]|nr:DUF2461 domain-containing protein [Chitinophagales bacterium]
MAKLHPQTLKYLSGLKRNNNKEWFEKNRPLYESVRNDFIFLVEAVINKLRKIDPSLGDIDPKSCLFRINRDVRFSKDKSPYKINMAASISKGGRNSGSAGYYLHVQPGQNYIGGGIWMPERERLGKIRQEIDYNFSGFKKIVESIHFKKLFGGLDLEGKLARPPKNHSPENPAVEYLKLKSYIAGIELTDEEALSEKYLTKIVETFKKMNPLVTYLNRAMD